MWRGEGVRGVSVWRNEGREGHPPPTLPTHCAGLTDSKWVKDVPVVVNIARPQSQDYEGCGERVVGIG